MKIRTDFVTNSSSSGFVVVTLGFMDGSVIRAENDYSDGYGGYFWNCASEERLRVAAEKAHNGKDIYDLLCTSIQSFSEFIVRNGTGGKKLASSLKGLSSLDDLWFIDIEEQTHDNDGIEQGATYHHVFHPYNSSRIHGHGNRNFYPEDWEEYCQLKKRPNDSMTEKISADAKTITKHIITHNAQYGVFFLLWYAIDHKTELGLSDYDCQQIMSKINAEELSGILRIENSYLNILASDERKRSVFQRTCLNMLTDEKKPYKAREYVKYAIEYFSEDREILMKAYNMLLIEKKSPLPVLDAKEVDAFVVNYEIGQNDAANKDEGFNRWVNCKKNKKSVVSAAPSTKNAITLDQHRIEALAEQFDNYDSRQRSTLQWNDSEEKYRTIKANVQKYWIRLFGSYIEREPEITIPGSIFVFDNDIDDSVIERVREKGGVCRARRSKVSVKTSYLVVTGTPDGISTLSYVRDALLLQAKGAPVVIIALADLLKMLD